MLPLHHIRNVESGRFRILLLYPLSGCLTFGITLGVLPPHLGIIRHNEYYVKSRKQGSNLRPEIYKIPALSLSYFGKAPQPRFERGTAKLTVLSSTTELLGNGLENKSPTGTERVELPIDILAYHYSFHYPFILWFVVWTFSLPYP